MPRRVSSPEFVGRGPELAALLDALDRAAGGEFSAVFLAGEAGVGKSRLLTELVRAARERGARVLAGDCVMLAEGELPYAPVRAALRGLPAELEPDALDELLGSARVELARLVPELGGADASVPAESIVGASLAQPRLFELVLALLARLGREAPVALAIEDIHWADRSTRDLIAFLVASARRERLLLVCSYRTDELHRRHPFRRFVAQQESRRSAERVDVLPFTPDELDAQLRGILGSDPDVALRRRLFERAGGNAFLTEELLAASPDGTELPASLRDALTLRIEMLPEPAQEVLRVAATHGRVVPHRLLAAVCGLPDPELHTALREAIANHVLVPWEAESLAFRHALIQETLHADLLPGERAGLHLALAQVLDDDPTLVSRDGRAAAQLYSHWLGAHRLPEALAAAVRAGGEAEDVYAFAEASHHFERALELWERVDGAEQRAGLDDAGLYARAAEDAYLTGEHARAITLVRLAIKRISSAADPPRAALLWERLGRYLWLAGDADAAHAAYMEAVGLLPADQPQREQARVLAALGQLLFLRGRPADSIEVTERAIEVARQVGARAEEGHALGTLGANAMMLGDRESGRKLLREALEIAEQQGEAADLCRAYRHLSDALDQSGELEASVEIALEGARRASELGLRSYTLVLNGEAATHALKLGRLAEAELLTGDALDVEPSLRKSVACEARSRTLMLCGRLEDAETALDAADEALRDADSMWGGIAGATRAELAIWRGRADVARMVTEATLAGAAEHEFIYYTARAHAVGARAEAALAERARASGDDAGAAEAVARARRLVERIEGLLAPELWRGTPPQETAAYAAMTAAEAARAAGSADADTWRTVAELWAACGLVLDAAYAALRQAECLVLAGKREPASEVVQAALATAGGCGAQLLVDQLQALARRARLVAAPSAAAEASEVADALERLGLTERERAVLELVAAGMTNRQIGERLFMAEKTASVHVSRILAKLAVGSRVEAATAAQRLGLVD